MLDKTQPNKFEQAGMNPFNSPVPGESLTQDPNQKFPWEQPSEINDVDSAIKEIFINNFVRVCFFKISKSFLH